MSRSLHERSHATSQTDAAFAPLQLTGEGLTVERVVEVARGGRRVAVPLRPPAQPTAPGEALPGPVAPGATANPAVGSVVSPRVVPADRPTAEA
jgi:hypothetical protein